MKKYFLLITFLFGVAYGQSFLKTLPKPTVNREIFFADTTLPAIVQDLLRPVLEISAYGFPGNILLAGGGFSYQHLKFLKDRWKCIWSVSYITWYNLKKVYTGLTLGLLNNLILVGVAAHSKEIIGTLGIGININN